MAPCRGVAGGVLLLPLPRNQARKPQEFDLRPLRAWLPTILIKDVVGTIEDSVFSLCSFTIANSHGAFRLHACLHVHAGMVSAKPHDSVCPVTG